MKFISKYRKSHKKKYASATTSEDEYGQNSDNDTYGCDSETRVPMKLITHFEKKENNVQRNSSSCDSTTSTTSTEISSVVLSAQDEDLSKGSSGLLNNGSVSETQQNSFNSSQQYQLVSKEEMSLRDAIFTRKWYFQPPNVANKREKKRMAELNLMMEMSKALQEVTEDEQL